MNALLLAVWRLVLRLYPRTVRERWGTAMEEAYLRMLDRSSGRTARVIAGVRGWIDVLAGAVRERWKGDLRARGVETGRTRRGGRETMTGWIRDVRFALRRLRKAPGFTFVAAGSLALGIAANVAVFSVANAVLLKPLPGIANYDRVVDLGRSTRGSGHDTFAYPELVDIREQIPALEDAAAVSFQMLSISQGAEGVRAMGFGVDPAYFSILGTDAALGRLLLPEEGDPADPQAVVVVSHRFWTERMGADPDVIGRSLLLNRLAFTVVGVMDPDFRGHLIGLAPEVIVPIGTTPALSATDPMFDQRNASWHTGIGLLAEGADLEGLGTQLDALAARLAEAYPETNELRGFGALPLGPVPGGGRTGVRLFVTALLGMVVLILLVTCTNVAGMFLARGTARSHEMSVRLALGAGRGRLIQQLTVETLLIFLLGGGAGLLLAAWAVGLLRPELLPTPVPVSFDIGIDLRVVVFAVGTTLLTGLVFGLLPAARSTRVGIAGAMKDANRGGERSAGRLRMTFAAAQIGFSLVLLVAAGLFVRSLQRAAQVETGFDPTGVYVTLIDLSLEGYDPDEARIAQASLLERLRGHGRVSATALATDLPLDLSSRGTQVVPEGWSGEAPDGRLRTGLNQVTPGYFEALGMSLLAGRGFEARDVSEAPRVAVVSRAFAEEAWPGEDALGRNFAVGTATDPSARWTVVGVVEDSKNQLLTEETSPFVYFPLAQNWAAMTQVVIRTDAPRAEALTMLRSAILEGDPNISLGAVTSLEQYTSIGILPQRIAAALTTALGALALILSGLGIYGVVSYSVGRRRREIGIRMALGADRASVARRFLRGAALLALPGLVIGGALSLVVGRLLRSLLLDLSPADPVALVSVSTLLVAMVLIAAWIPARRAARVDPSISLRQD